MTGHSRHRTHPHCSQFEDQAGMRHVDMTTRVTGTRQ
jgi:hypothetical protein